MYYLSLVGFFAIFSTTISKNPVLPLFSQALGAGDAVIGMIAAVSPLAGILFSFPVGVLSDHIGRRRLLVLSGLVFLFAPLLYLFITTAVWLIPVRFFHGTATAILGPVISAAIAERFPSKKGEMLGQYSSATLIGRTLAPLAGGWILSYFVLFSGLIQYQMVYLTAALAAVPVCVLVLWYPKDPEKTLDIPGFPVFYAIMRTFFFSSRLRVTAMIEMTTHFAFGMFETFLPLFLFKKGHRRRWDWYHLCRAGTHHRRNKTCLFAGSRIGSTSVSRFFVASWSLAVQSLRFPPVRLFMSFWSSVQYSGAEWHSRPSRQVPTLPIWHDARMSEHRWARSR